jgi:hypothetical protein
MAVFFVNNNKYNEVFNNLNHDSYFMYFLEFKARIVYVIKYPPL